MKQRSREINVFNVSALDLFASALGAFILMSLVFMVFFSMTSRDSADMEDTRTALRRCEAQLVSAETVLEEVAARNAVMEERLGQSVQSSALQMCEAQLEATKAALRRCTQELESATGVVGRLERTSAELEACRSALRKTFVLVIASWGSRDDVDLHVVDPAGREYYYDNRRQTGSAAALEEDNVRGPGNEVWLHPAAEPGTYRVCYKLFRGSRSAVRGSVLWQEGKIEVPNVTLSRMREVRVAVEVEVDEEGLVSVDRSRAGQVLGTDGCGSAAGAM